MTDNNTIKRHIYYILVNDTTYEKPMTSEVLRLELTKRFNVHITDVTLRQLFSELRKEIFSWDVPAANKLLMTYDKGFCLAQTEEQYEHGIKYVSSRIVPLAELERAMSKTKIQVFGTQTTLQFQS